MAGLLATAITTPWYIFSVDIGGTRYNKSTFLTCVVLTTCITPATAAVQLLAPYFSGQVRRSIRAGRWAWKRQALWALWILPASLGSWIVLYMVAVGFAFAVPKYPAAANLLLPLVTGVVENAFVAITGKVYGLTLNSPGRGDAVVRGDQRLVMLMPIAWSHAFAEAQKLCSLLSAGVREGGSGWTTSLAVGFVSSLLSRSEVLRKYQARLLPRCVVRKLVPGVVRVLHSRVKFSLGYPRFVVPVCIAVSRLVRGEKKPLFNDTAMWIVLMSVVVEICEDVVMARKWLPTNTWALEFEPFYKQMRADSAMQVLHFDCRGVATSCNRDLRNLRYADFWTTGGWMAPMVLFPLCLLQLLLGFGFLSNVCPSPMEIDQLFANALIWTSPLSCG